MGFIAGYLGKFLYLIYNTVAFENYGLAIIIFTILIKTALLPLTLKQVKSSAKMQEVQPKIQEIQRMYKNDKQKLNEEIMKFYQENKINPASGCLPLLVQMPILFSLYWAIARPIEFMLGKSQTDVNHLVKITANLAKGFKDFNIKSSAYTVQIEVLNFFNEHKEKLSSVTKYLKKEELLHMSFPFEGFGVNLGSIPTFNIKSFSDFALLIIPALAVVFTYISTRISMPKTTKGKGKEDKNAQMMGFMVYFAPVMTLIFVFQFPVGLALYWLTGYIFQIGQQLIINKYKKKEEVGIK